jgi:hypothetical protein
LEPGRAFLVEGYVFKTKMVKVYAGNTSFEKGIK